MGLFNRFKKREAEEALPAALKAPAPPGVTAYSGMRVEVTTLDGRILFVAKLMGLQGNRAELHQYAQTPTLQRKEPLQVRIRGYHDRERKALCMEGTISPLSQRVWQVEYLTVTKAGNDRAFYRLDTDLEATAIIFSGPDAGEWPCRLMNVSVGGACIRSHHAYREGDKFLLKMKLLEDREPSIIFCKVLRVIHQSEVLGEYGCQFLEMNEGAQERITEDIFASQRQQRSRETEMIG